MRTHGNLTKWNDDRGFGFISPAGGGAEVFVHISAFPRDGRRPTVGELVSYETDAGSDGKARAIRIMRAGQKPRVRTTRPVGGDSRASGLLGTILGVLAIGAIAGYGYTRLRKPDTPPPSTLSPPVVQQADSPFKCDGRTMCSQMTSCAEAHYFVLHCPNTKMDGNGDGEPCEQQWCNAD